MHLAKMCIPLNTKKKRHDMKVLNLVLLPEFLEQNCQSSASVQGGIPG